MDRLHKPLVAACKVVAAGSRIVMQPESHGGSFIEDVGTKRKKRIFERNGVYVLPRWVVKQTSQKRSEKNMDVSVEETGPVSVEEISPESIVEEAEELKHGSLTATVLPSKAKVEAHNVSYLPLRSWCSACVRGRGLSLGSPQSRHEDEGGRTDTDGL